MDTDMSTMPVRSDSTAIVNQALADGPGFLHADFGGGGAYGIPYVTVPGTQAKVPIDFTLYPDESRRRGRPADLFRSGPLRRGGQRRDSPRCASR